MAVGAQGEHGMGSVYHELEIISETSILHLPIKANILPVCVCVCVCILYTTLSYNHCNYMYN